MKTFEDALIASIHIEIETGTLRSVGALYALMLPFMCNPENYPPNLPEKYVKIHEAIRCQWPGKGGEGLAALDKAKKIGWKNHDKLAALQTSVNHSPNQGEKS